MHKFIKSTTHVTLRLSSNIICPDGTNFLHGLLLKDRQVASLCRVFANTFSANIKLSKTQLCKIIQLGRLVDRLHGPLTKVGLRLMKNVLQPLAKSVLIPLGLTA